MTVEDSYRRAERSLDADRRRSVRRTPGVVIGILSLLVLAVGVTAAVDLRRLSTPRGSALAWTEAATFGECRGYRELSAPAPSAAADGRTEEEVCRSLRERTAPNREDPREVQVEVLEVEQDGDEAQVEVSVTTAEGTRTPTLELVRDGDRWRVLRDAEACAEVGCG